MYVCTGYTAQITTVLTQNFLLVVWMQQFQNVSIPKGRKNEALPHEQGTAMVNRIRRIKIFGLRLYFKTDQLLETGLPRKTQPRPQIIHDWDVT
jgi:hypothetical protein